MGMRHTIDESSGIVRMTWDGKATVADWVVTMDLIQADPRFRSGLKFLSDRRTCTAIPTPDEIQVSVDYFVKHQARLGHTHWAIVVHDILDYGMMRLGETMAGPLITMAYFEKEAAAERWVTELRTRSPSRER
jgi:hypothetical protein